jgi:glyoxylase-like metal-dependent hydrolase (beta-lactamase superfamily II)
MAVATEPKPAALPLPGGRPGAGVRVHPLRTGEMLAMPRFLDRPPGRLGMLRGSGLLTPRSRWTPVPIPCFLVEHPGAGPILLDTGLPPAAAHDVGAALGRRAKLLLRISMAPGWAVTDQLRARGVEPADVRLVVMTHLHYDHAGAVAELPGASFVVDGDEWRAASAHGLLHGYRHRLFDHPFDWRTVDFGAPPAEPFAAFARTLDLLGDGSIRLLSTPGHSAGHLSVLLRLAGGGELLVTADAAYARRTIADGLLPTLVGDDRLYRRSLEEIRRFVADRPATEVVCGHDAEGWPHVRARYD